MATSAEGGFDNDPRFSRGRGNDPDRLNGSKHSDAGRLAEEAEEALMLHLLDRAHYARQKYGQITASTLSAFLQDGECVRYPTRLVFEAGEMAPHQFAHPGEDISMPGGKGRILYLRPSLKQHPQWLSPAVVYMVPVINYGEDVVNDLHCIRYGAALLGMSEESFYTRICEIADALGMPPKNIGS